MADDMPDFKRLLDAGQLLTAGIASGEIQVPK
jgi:hypothetical protein